MAKIVDDELETAILKLDEKEKNKLLMRLVRKDKILIEQLRFRLLEGSDFDLRFRKDEAKMPVLNNLAFIGSTNRSRVILTNLKADLKEMGLYKKITGDKIGDIELSIFCLVQYVTSYEGFFNRKFYDYYSHRLLSYTYKKLEAIIKNIRSQHEDYAIEFEADINILLKILNYEKNKYVDNDLPDIFEA